CAELRQACEFSRDQGHTLPARPALDLLLALPGFVDAGVLLSKDQSHRQAFTRVFASATCRVLLQASLEVASTSDVEAAVTAAEYVDVGHEFSVAFCSLGTLKLSTGGFDTRWRATQPTETRTPLWV